jgi:hypothetical protein
MEGVGKDRPGKDVWGGLFFFFVGTLGATDGFKLFHPLFNRWLGKVCALFEFLQHARTLIFFLEALNRSVNGFVLLNNDAYQMKLLCC